MDDLSVLTWRMPGAPAAVVEAATLPEPERAAQLAALRDHLGAREIVYVPTCQRVVLILLHAPPDAHARAPSFYAQRLGREVPAPERLEGYDAFRHLCETASSLHSLVVGEPQVLGQFKAAAHACDEHGLSGAGLRHVFSLVFRVAKAVRAETELFQGKVSLVPLTEDLLAEHLADKPDAVAAVLGTGQIGERMVELLRRTRPDIRLHVVSRDPKRAQVVAAQMGVQGHALRDFLAKPPAALDVLALAIPADAPLVREPQLLALAAQRPLLVLDLAIPRNAETPRAPPPQLRVVQMDDLTRLSESAKERREAETGPARVVLERELDRVRAEYETRKLAHDLARLNERFEAVMRERLAQLSAAGVDANDPAFVKWYEQTVRALQHEAAEAVKRAGCGVRRT